MNNKNKNNAKQYMLFELYIVYCILYIVKHWTKTRKF